MSEKKKSTGQSETAEPKARAGDRETKSARAAARVERENRPARRENRQPASKSTSSSGTSRFRNNQIVRFIRDAYQELRYKVTWPTFEEARNMTLTVVVLSACVGLILGLADAGLFQLFRLITGK